MGLNEFQLLIDFVRSHPDAFTLIFGLLCGWLGYRSRRTDQLGQRHKDAIRKIEEVRSITLQKIKEERAVLAEEQKAFRAEKQRHAEQAGQKVITPGTAFADKPESRVVELSYYVNGAKRVVRKRG